MQSRFHIIALAILMLAGLTPAHADSEPRRPNIVLVIIDDQGIGDLGVTGNPAIRTPELDRLWNESAHFTDFHVDPMCSPTRAALMTGRSSLGAGVYWTVMGRNLLPADRLTMAEVLRANGYRTGLFGKWHLGDNYPYRPQDQGFDEVVMLGGGGIGQTWDQWGNTYWGGTYLVNGAPRRFAQYANDVWFDEAEKFIRAEHAAGRPFFAYIPTNNAHSPYRAPYETVKPYLDAGLPEITARFYAAITEVDRRVGTLRKTLAQIGAERDTIFIYMSDNGTAVPMNIFLKGSGAGSFEELRDRNPQWAGWQWNDGLRDKKGSVWEGGQRVPLMLRWPAVGIENGHEIDALTAHYDLLPTIIDWLDLKVPEKPAFEGASLVPLLSGGKMPDRNVIVTAQNARFPAKDRPAVVMTEGWRYLPNEDGGALFAIDKDIGQQNNVASKFPNVVWRMQKAFDAWWEARKPEWVDIQRIMIGTRIEPVTRLTAIDAALPEGKFPTTAFPWYPGESDLIYDGNDGIEPWIGRETDIAVHPIRLEVAVSGTYRVSLFLHDKPAVKIIPFADAHLTLNGTELHKPVQRQTANVDFDVKLERGPLDLSGFFASPAKAGGKPVTSPAFYLYIEKIAE